MTTCRRCAFINGSGDGIHCVRHGTLIPPEYLDQPFGCYTPPAGSLESLIAQGKRYNVIYADPSWDYRDKAKDGNRGAEVHYSCMTEKEITEMPVPSVSAEDCRLFMWVTGPQLETGLRVIKSWGFRYSSFAFIWVKMDKATGTRPIMGMGNNVRANAEVVLLGIKGSPPRESSAVNQVIFAPRGEHSQKPAEVRDRIIELCGDVPRLEMFAREVVPGWDYHGNEVIR